MEFGKEYILMSAEMPGYFRKQILVSIIACLLLFSCSGAQENHVSGANTPPRGGATRQIKETNIAVPRQETSGTTIGSQKTDRTQAVETTSQSAEFKVVVQSQVGWGLSKVAVSPDGRFVLTTSLRLWDADSGILIKKISDPDDPEMFDADIFDFMKDNERIVSYSDRGVLKIWHIATGEKLRTIGFVKGGSVSWDNRSDLDLLPDGIHALRAYPARLPKGKSVVVELVNLDRGRVVKTYTPRCAPKRRGAMIGFTELENHLMPGGKGVVTVCENGEILAWDLAAGDIRWKAQLKYKKGSEYLEEAVVAPRGDYLVTGGGNAPDGALLLVWDVRTGKIVRKAGRKGRISAQLIDFLDDRQIAIRFARPNSETVEAVDITTLKTSKVLFNQSTYSGHLKLSPDRKRFLAIGKGGGQLHVLDVRSGERIQTFNEKSRARFKKMVVAAESAVAEFVTTDESRYRWNADTIGFSSGICAKCDYEHVAYSPDGSLRAELRSDEVSLFDTKSEKLLAKRTKESCYEVEFSRDGKHIFAETVSRPTETWSLPSLTPVTSIPPIERANLVTGKGRMLSDGRHFIGNSPGLTLWNAQTGTHLLTYADRGHALFADAWAVSKDEKKLLAVCSPSARISTNQLVVFDLWTGELLGRYKYPFITRQVAFIRDSDHALVLDNRGILSIWNLKTWDHVFFVVSGREWLLYTEDGYFDSSRRGGEMVALVSGLNGFRIDQFAVHYNRPDIILRRLGFGSNDLLEHFRKLYNRRVRKLGLPEGQLKDALQNAPVVKIIDVKREGKIVRLEFDCRDDDVPLNRYNIYVNDVPLLGADGSVIEGHHQRIEQKIELTGGRNKIEVVVMNRLGIESLRDSVILEHKSDQKGNLYYLGFGVSKYKDTAMNLRYASKDIKDLGNVFESFGKTFEEVHTRMYLDEQVTRDTIADALKFLMGAGVDDIVVMFVAGHGLYAHSKNSGYYYLIHDSRIDDLSQTAIPFVMFEDLLTQIRPLRKLFLMDTCQSGELDPQEEKSVLASASSDLLLARGIRKIRSYKNSNGLGNNFSDRRRYIYNDLFRRSGAIVFSSSQGRELSYERDDLENGVFTEEILRAFTSNKADFDKDGHISTDELRDYVTLSVAEQTNGLQHPVVDRDNLEMQFKFPLVANY